MGESGAGEQGETGEPTTKELGSAVAVPTSSVMTERRGQRNLFTSLLATLAGPLPPSPFKQPEEAGLEMNLDNQGKTETRHSKILEKSALAECTVTVPSRSYSCQSKKSSQTAKYKSPFIDRKTKRVQQGIHSPFGRHSLLNVA